MDVDHLAVLVADLAVGVLLLVTAALTWPRSRSTATLVAAVAATWLVAFLLPIALFWHRGVLVHALLAHPHWRPRRLPAVATTAAAYAVSVLAPVLWLDDRSTILLAFALAGCAGWNLRGARGVVRARHMWSFGVTLMVSTTLLGIAVARLVWGSGAWFTSLVAYDVAVLASCALLYAGLGRAQVSHLTDLVVDLGDMPARPVRDALARALQDPDLVVATWDPMRGAYADADGHTVAADSAPGRSITRVERDGRPFVLLEHDAAIAEDPRLHEALQAAARMEAVNASWQVEVADQAAAVQASRARLVEAADLERLRLESELRGGVEARLAELAATLSTSPKGGQHLERAVDQLERTRSELRELASGLRPHTLEAGLAAALRDLVESAPISVTLRVDVGPVPSETEATVYYVCAESLANAAKHAPGASVVIDVGAGDGWLRAEVSDDGPGGAAMTDQGGLLGLRDRAEALGGSLTLASDPGGTRVVAELPLDHRT